MAPGPFIPGQRQCVGGKEYMFVPVSGVVHKDEATSANAAVVDVLVQAVALLQQINRTFEFENTYKGMYRNIVDLPIKAATTNFPINIGFPVRLFYLTTANPIVLRLTSPAGDEIPLTSATSPYQLENLPAGLAFDTVLISNASTNIVTISIFAMG